MHRFVRMALGLLLGASLLAAQQPQKIKINYPARTGTTWPLYIAKDGFFEQLFGSGVKAEEERKAKIAFK